MSEIVHSLYRLGGERTAGEGEPAVVKENHQENGETHMGRGKVTNAGTGELCSLGWFLTVCLVIPPATLGDTCGILGLICAWVIITIIVG